jgi:DNA invertase Pin-like site-specific DNA recombinase
MNPVTPSAHNKVQRHHQERVAVVYVRQSTPQQVTRHPESTRLQYGLVDRALMLGWERSQVQVIDDDLGKSGATAQGRAGFQRLVSAVSLNQVGLVLGIEMSRLARSCRDWYQLLEVCGLFGTLIGDWEGIYDPGDYNDRLLLGLKGTMSEAELYLIKQRMLAGKRAKADRGELGMALPRGYVRQPSGEVAKDPDEQVQTTILLIFDEFERLGSLNGVLQYLVRHHIALPRRIRSGLRKGDLEWHPPNRATLADLLHNPIYAGAYVYGRRPTDPRRRQAGRPATGRLVARPEQWSVLHKNRLPAYISWEQFERNQRQMEANSARGIGAVRNGPSLLSGLVICGRCGLRMTTSYHNNGHSLRYGCNRMAVDYGEPLCQSLTGQVLDDFVATEVLRALQPAALEISLQAAQEVEAERLQKHRHWQQRLERAHYDAERAARQYHAVEPEHRLVARTLERQWEEALNAESQLHADYASFHSEQPACLSAEQQEAIRRLASDIPRLWHAASTTAAERQAIVRQLIEQVIVTVRGESERVDIQTHWKGGHATAATITRPVARLDQLSYYPQLAARVVTLHGQGHTNAAIAQVLNDEDWRPAKRCQRFNASMVNEMRVRLGLRTRQCTPGSTVQRLANEWTLAELAHQLDMPLPTLYNWLRRGQFNARKVMSQSHRLWLVQTTEEDLQRLRSLRTEKSDRALPVPSNQS